MSGVPEGWAYADLSEVTEVTMGQSPPSSAYNDVGLGLPFLQGKAEFGALYPMPVKWCTVAKKVAEADDILLSVRAPVGPTNLSPTRCCIGRGLAALRPFGDMVMNRFILYQIRAREHELERLGHGVTFKAIRKKELTSWRMLVAPLPEQHRIVAKIGSLLAKLDDGVAALKRAEANLERYRASVLKAGVEGRLTKRWRRENPPEETGEELLRRILAERRKRWEAEQLAKFEAKGKNPPKNWKEKGKEPITPDASGLPGLPEGWCWATVDQVSVAVQYGSSAKTSSGAEGVPVLRMGNIQQGALDLESLKYLPRDHREFPKLLLADGDLLFNRTNSAELVGKTTVYRGRPDPCSFASYLIRVRTVRARLSTVVASALNSSWGRAWIASVVSQQVGQANVNGTKLRAFPFPLPPETEQDEITRLSGDAGESVTRLTGATTDLLRKTTVLRQSILKHAFEGRLVPQDPADEPASVLLERIRAEQDPERKRRKGRRSNRKRQCTSRTT